MCVGDASLETGAVASAERLLTLSRDQNQLSLEHINEFVLGFVPMTLARPGSRRESRHIDAELSQPCRIAEAVARALATRGIIGSRIARAGDQRRRIKSDFLAHG